MTCPIAEKKGRHSCPSLKDLRIVGDGVRTFKNLQQATRGVDVLRHVGRFVVRPNEAVEKPDSEHLFQLWVDFFQTKRLFSFLASGLFRTISIANLPDMASLFVRYRGKYSLFQPLYLA